MPTFSSFPTCLYTHYCCQSFQQSCYRGYRDFVSYVVKSFSVVQLQACVRRHQAQRLLKRLAQDREGEFEQEYLLQNAAATAIVSETSSGTSISSLHTHALTQPFPLLLHISNHASVGTAALRGTS